MGERAETGTSKGVVTVVRFVPPTPPARFGLCHKRSLCDRGRIACGDYFITRELPFHRGHGQFVIQGSIQWWALGRVILASLVPLAAV